MTEENNNNELRDDDFKGVSEDVLLAYFASQLIEEKGEEDADGKKAAELVEELRERINGKILEQMPEEKLSELNTKFAQDGFASEALNAAVKEAEINTEEITERVLDEFRNEYLGKEEA